MAIEESKKQDADDSTPSSSLAHNDGSTKHSNEKTGVEHTAQKPASSSLPPAPDGGTLAWLQVIGNFMLLFNTFGILNTFDVYQTYYESGQLFVESSSNISWIGSIQAFSVLLFSAIVGPIYDRGYFRTLVLVGSFLVVFGHMMLSLCHEFWQCVLAQGFTIGIGASCLFVPSVAIMPTYFSSNLGLALGIANSGSSMGGIIYPIMFYRLIDQVGFGWSVRILGFTSLATLLIPIFVMKMRVKPPAPRSIIDSPSFKDVPYLTFVVGLFFGFCGLYAGLFYISYFGQETGYTSASLSFYLVAILNAGSVVGRIAPNWLSDKIGPANVIAPGPIILGILLLCLIAVRNAGGLIVIALLFGFFSGPFIALPAVVSVKLTTDKSKIGTRIGMGYAIGGLGILCGGPGAGGILGTQDPLHWTGTWIYGGVTSVVSGCLFFVVRGMMAGRKVMVNV